MKKCTGPCGRELDESEFYVKDKKSGRRFARCKTCHNKQSQADYHGPKHAERLEQRKQYGKKHRTERTAYVREWRKANPEKNREIGQRSDAVRKGDPVRRVKKRGYAATYRRKHADAIAAYNEAYRERNRMVLRLRYRMWCQANPDAYEAIRLRWRRANRATVNAATHRRRALLRGCAGTWTAEEWAALKEAQDHTCLACGLREPEILLTPDHVHPLAKGGDNTLLNLQGLCGSCNSQKGVGTTDLRDDALATFLADVLKYGIDFDGDGHIDMANNPADVIGSVAHYLAEHGWQRGQPTHYPVKPPVDTADRAALLAAAEPLRAQIRALVVELHKMRPTRRPVTMQQAAAWRRFQKAMGGDGYFVEYASVGEIADAVVDLILKGEGK